MHAQVVSSGLLMHRPEVLWGNVLWVFCASAFVVVFAKSERINLAHGTQNAPASRQPPLKLLPQKVYTVDA